MKKCKIKAITHFKVVKDGINWKPACDFLLVINTNWHPIYHCFGGLGTMYDVHLRLFGKERLPISVNWTFFAMCYGWGAMGENRSKIGNLQTGGSSSSTKFSHRKNVSHHSFLHGWLGQWMSYSFVADSFHTKKLCSRLSSSEVRFYVENSHFTFLSPRWRAQGQRTIIILGSLESA